LRILTRAVSEKLPGPKKCGDEDKEEHEFLGVFDVFLNFKVTPT